MRHAPADYGPPDPERRLSKAGRQQAERMARFMAKHDFYAFAEVWSSPYLRARQTAGIMIGEMAARPPLHLNDRLLPQAAPEAILKELEQLGHSVLLVGHNPHMALLARRMLGIGQADLPFKKTGLFAFKKQDSSAGSGYRLLAYVTPASLGI